MIDGCGLDIERDEDFLAVLGGIVSLSGFFKNIAQAMIDAKYPAPVEEEEDKEKEKEKPSDEDKRREKEEKEKEKEKKKKEKEKKKSKETASDNSAGVSL
jgi:hypothetical protein